MIPILYEHSERRFLTNGICRLSDCMSCIVTEERNGIYECEFTYPVDGENYSEIKIGRVIAATHDDTGDIQPFDIYAKSAPIDGVVTFNAHHISYRLSDIVVMPFEAGSCSDAMQKISKNSANTNPFSFWTSKSASGRYKLDEPKNVRSVLGGEQGSLLDVYGKGDYQFDRFNVRLYTNRGVDSGVQIRYGKNMTDLKYTEDNSDTYNAVVPYWLDSQTGEIVTLPGKYLVFSGATLRTAYLTDQSFLIIRTETDEPIEVAYTSIEASTLDMSSDFKDKPTVAELRNAATTKFQNSYAWLPSQTVDVDFVQLWQTQEYKDYAPLQRVRLCDTVSVYYPKLGVEAVKEKVIKTVYNVLLDRYDSIELGTPQTTLAQAMTGTIESMIQDLPTVDIMDSAIQYATEMITGNKGGYVVMKPNAAGQPEEFLILDNEDINQAVNVWRWNASGLGHSHNGYNGPYDDVAITMDGAINANAITVGNLWANLITAGKITSKNGLVYFDLDNNELACSSLVGETTSANMGGYTYGSTYYGYLRIYNSRSKQYGLYIEPDASAGTVWMEAENMIKIEAAPVGNKDRSASKVTVHNRYVKLDAYNGYGSSATWKASLSVGENDTWKIYLSGDTKVNGNISVSGTKARAVKTENYADRALYCYETPTPLFGDIGEARIGDDGLCYVDIDDIFSETIENNVEYQVFLQKEGDGDCWVSDKARQYFIIEGTPGLKVAWELKAKQKGYAMKRLDYPGELLEQYINIGDDVFSLEDYITEQEELING